MNPQNVPSTIVNAKHPPYLASPEVTYLEDKLRLVAIGDQIEYAALARAIGRDPASPAGHVNRWRHWLDTAKRHLEKEGIYFGTRATVGLQRLDDLGKLAKCAADVRHVIRTSRRSEKRATSVDFPALPPQGKEEYTRAVTLSRLVAMASKAKVTARLLKRGPEVSTIQMVEAFLSATKESYPPPPVETPETAEAE